MTIKEDTWNWYVDNLRAASDKAAEGMEKSLEGVDLSSLSQAGRQDLITKAYALATHYGEGAAEASCEMYDAVAEASGRHLPSAEPAPTATYQEAAKAVNGTIKTGNPEIVSQSVGRMVKMAGVDSMMKNAIRDGAEWAWIPQGNETCAFCIMLASRGWQHASKDALKNGHAEHIHAHCDCIYAVRFDSSTEYEGYNPDKYLQMYEDAEGDTWQEKVNYMRREISKENKSDSLTNDRNDVRISTLKYVYTNGHRNESPLSENQCKEAEKAARIQGFTGSIGYSDHINTSIAGYPNENGSRSKESALLIIGTDAYPALTGKTANERLSLNCCMAHEVIGHHEAWAKHTDQADPILEEVQASLRASLFGVGLTDEERELLRQDAMDRLTANNIRFDDIKDQIDIVER